MNENAARNKQISGAPGFVTKSSGYKMNPQAPVAQKVADEVVFRRFRGEGVEFC